MFRKSYDGLTVHDALYGRFVLPSYVATLVLTPEVRRLSQVRLLNSLTPTLAALGEVRRYSHTLGVLHLGQQVAYLRSAGDASAAAFAGAVLAHDIATPPFGHVMEYHLMERRSWHHEAAIRSVLLGTHAPENRAHQIFAGRTIEFVSTLRRAKIPVETVIEIVSKRHPLSALLFGSLDLDNLDNVARMATFLGHPEGAEVALRIANDLGVTPEGELILPHEDLELVLRWGDLRRKVYELLLFDPYTIASQAVLWDAIRVGFDAGFLTEDDAFLTDEQLLEELRGRPETKDRIILQYLGKPPNVAVCLQLRGTLLEYGIRSRRQAQLIVERVLVSEFKTDAVLGYVQVDAGTFGRRLEFRTPRGKPWAVGTPSQSVIFYGFVRQKPREAACKRASRALLEALTAPADHVLRSGATGTGENAEPSLNFTPSED